MAGKSPDELWNAALGELEVQVSRANYNTWLRGTRGVSVTSDTFVVGAPSPFATVWLERNMSPLIRKTLTKVLGSEVNVVYQVLAPAEAAPLPPTLLHSSKPARPTRTTVSGFNGTPLNPRYTFDTFIVGEQNRFAHAAALAVADNPGKSYNPLFVYDGGEIGRAHV